MNNLKSQLVRLGIEWPKESSGDLIYVKALSKDRSIPRHLCLAADWRQEIYDIHSDLFFALSQTLSDKHPKFDDNEDNLKFVKSFYLRTCFFYWQACNDKLGQFINEIFNLGFKERDVHLCKLLKARMKPAILIQKIEPELNKYCSSGQFKYLNDAVNHLKHKWSQHYLGIKARSDVETNELGATTIGFGRSPVDWNVFEADLNFLIQGNNEFVKLANHVNGIYDSMLKELGIHVQDGNLTISLDMKKNTLSVE
jgi:hypothetical protein